MHKPDKPEFPEPGEMLAPGPACAQTLHLLARRRSTLARNMSEPGPSRDQLETLLAIAARTPDHGKLFPWRFIVFEGEARADFGALLEARLRETEPDGPPERYEFERERFMRAPVVVAVISSPADTQRIPEWEQILSAGAACQNLLIATGAMGFAVQWLTEWCAYDPFVLKAMGLQAGERVAGFIYIGTAKEAPAERPRAGLKLSRWNA